MQCSAVKCSAVQYSAVRKSLHHVEPEPNTCLANNAGGNISGGNGKELKFLRVLNNSAIVNYDIQMELKQNMCLTNNDVLTLLETIF